MKESTKAQWEEAKMTPAGRQDRRGAQIQAAQERIDPAKSRQK